MTTDNRLDGVDKRVINLEERTHKLEAFQNAQKTLEAVNDERRKHMDKRFDTVENGIDKLNGHLTKVVWLIVASILGGVMTFILGGGLANVG